MKCNYKVIISGGGTGGHIFPAISIANALKVQDNSIDILFVGALGKMEMERVPAAGYPIKGLPVAGLKRSFSLENLYLPFKVIKSIALAGKIIREFKPDVVVGVGGYASAPLLWSAKMQGIPYLIQEQNSYAGLTNRILGKGASKICVAYNGMEKFFPKDKILITGNPIRSDIAESSIELKKEALIHFGLDPNKKCILIIGGSLGARQLNNCIKSLILENKTFDLQILWQYGKVYKQEIEQFMADNPRNYIYQMEFISRMDLAFAGADLVITRAGAGTISELCVAKKATIFVPSPNVTEDHQTHNAMALVENDAAIIVRDVDANEELIKTALELVHDELRIKTLEDNIGKLAFKNSSKIIAEEVIKLIKK